MDDIDTFASSSAAAALPSPRPLPSLRTTKSLSALRLAAYGGLQLHFAARFDLELAGSCQQPDRDWPPVENMGAGKCRTLRRAASFGSAPIAQPAQPQRVHCPSEISIDSDVTATATATATGMEASRYQSLEEASRIVRVQLARLTRVCSSSPGKASQ